MGIQQSRLSLPNPLSECCVVVRLGLPDSTLFSLVLCMNNLTKVFYEYVNKRPKASTFSNLYRLSKINAQRLTGHCFSCILIENEARNSCDYRCHNATFNIVCETTFIRSKYCENRILGILLYRIEKVLTMLTRPYTGHHVLHRNSKYSLLLS